MVEKFTNISVTSVDFDPFEGSEIEHVAPSTESQKEIWASCIIGGEDANLGFNESLSIRLKGFLDISTLEKSFKTLVERNESLRSVFSANGKQICIFKENIPSVFYQDISQNSAEHKNDFLKAFVKQDALHLFSLTNGPLIKISLFKLEEAKYQLIFTAHHIICDGWSFGIILQDLSKLYSSYTLGLYPDLAEAPLFSNYAHEQQLFVKSEPYQQNEKFWLEKFHDEIPVLRLPTDFQRPAVRTYKSNRLDFAIDKKLISEFKKVGVKNGCSLVVSLMAAFEVFLHRLTGQSDFTIGLPAAGQAATGNYRLIGHCVNLLPIRSKLSEDLSFSAYLKNRKIEMLDAYEHQQITFGSLLKKLKIHRDTATVPMIPVVFNIDIGLTDDVDFYGLEYEVTSNPREFENFDIFLNASGSETSFVLEWSYNTNLFKPESINRMMTGFENVIKSIIVDPDILLKDVLLMDAAEITKQLNARNNTKVEYPREKILIDLINESAEKNANKIALVYGNEELSFKELIAKANQLAGYIIKKNIHAGDVVGLALDRSPEMLIALLAIMKIGATFIPIDPELPRERVAFMLEDSSAAMLITSKKYHGRFSGNTIEIIIEDALTETKGQTVTDPGVVISENDTAYIIYTSGSTGQPKGVLIAQQSILNYIQSSIAAYSSAADKNSGTFFHLSLSFDAALTSLFVPLITGKILVMSSEAALEVFNDDNLVKYAPFDFIKLTPAQLYLLKTSKNDAAKYATKKFVIGGEALQKRHIDFLTLNGIDAEIINEYGPTETSVGCIFYKFNSLDDIRDDAHGILIGEPMPNVKVYILDKFLQQVPDNTEGEIFIGGIQVGKGYLNRPELTCEKFIADPFSADQNDKIYRTGDLGKYTSSGDIAFLGRADEQIKIRGYRIEPGEIEQLLIKQENVKQALVTVREDRPGDQRLIAYIVSENEISDDEFIGKFKEWKQVIKSKLPLYMLPSDFVNLIEIPLTINGKVDKKKLPKTDFKVITNTKAETPMEILITEIWEETIGVKHFGIHDDFFELGGHSLIAIEMMSILGKRIDKKVPVSTLLEYPTIYKLASVLDTGTNLNKWKVLVPIKPEGSKAPIYIVHGAGLGVLVFNELASAIDKDQPLYGLQGLGINGTDEPLTHVEDTAALYISEIIQQNPEGPYILAGFSDGGIIAFEMARQLQAIHKQVKMLAILDTCIEVAQTYKFNSFISRFKRSVFRLIPRLYYEVKCLITHPQKALVYQKECFRNRYINIAERLGFDFTPVEESLAVIEQAIEKHERSLSNYILKPYNGTIDLFRSKIRMNYVEDFKFLGWKPFVTNEIRIHEIPGDHEDMLLPANSKEFAYIFQKAIDNS